MQFETIRTSPDSRCDIYAANFTLSAIEHTIWTILFIFGLGQFIFSKDQWQIYENYNLLFVAFFVIFGTWGLEIYGISGTSKSNFIAMILVILFQLIRAVLTIFFIYQVTFRIQSQILLTFIWIVFGIALFIRLAIQKEITSRLHKGLKRKQCYEEI